jgi:hypothetical protein
VPSFATLISRAASRYLGVSGQTVARELARAAARELRGGTRDSAPSAPSAPAPSRLARGAYVLWLAGLALFALVVVNVDLFLPGGVSTVFRLLVGSVLLLEGAGLLMRRSPFRTVLVARLTTGAGRHPRRMRRTAWKHIVAGGLTLLGFAWIAAGMLDLLRGAIALL